MSPPPPLTTPSSEMSNFVHCSGQLPSKWRATFRLPVDVLSLFTASLNFLEVVVQLRILHGQLSNSDLQLSPIPPWMCSFPASTRSKPPLLVRFATFALCLYVTFHNPHECQFFTIQLSLLVRCATSYVALANYLAEYVQLCLFPPPIENTCPQIGRGRSCTLTNRQLAWTID